MGSRSSDLLENHPTNSHLPSQNPPKNGELQGQLRETSSFLTGKKIQSLGGNKKAPHNTESVSLLLSGLKIPGSSQNHCSPFNLFIFVLLPQQKRAQDLPKIAFSPSFPQLCLSWYPGKAGWDSRRAARAPAASRHIPGEDEVRGVVLGKATGNRENSKKCSNPAFSGRKTLSRPRQTGGGRM